MGWQEDREQQNVLGDVGISNALEALNNIV